MDSNPFEENIQKMKQDEEEQDDRQSIHVRSEVFKTFIDVNKGAKAPETKRIEIESADSSVASIQITDSYE